MSGPGVCCRLLLLDAAGGGRCRQVTVTGEHTWSKGRLHAAACSWKGTGWEAVRCAWPGLGGTALEACQLAMAHQAVKHEGRGEPLVG